MRYLWSSFLISKWKLSVGLHLFESINKAINKVIKTKIAMKHKVTQKPKIYLAAKRLPLRNKQNTHRAW